jgi:iron complex transport system substrate-binding protein
MFNKLKSVTIYVAVILMIAGWWFLAFNPENKSQIEIPFTAAEELKKPEIYEYLAPFDRSSIHKALSGDYDLMAKLILEWDVDAKILETQGLSGIRRLSRQSYVRSQVLGRQLNRSQSHKTLKQYLPQTYVSATFLLTLLDTDQIVGLPTGFRKQKNLFPPEIFANIPIDLDRYNSEKIFQKKPDLAFVANYSHPTTVQALQNQGIELFTLNAFNTIPEIASSIQQVGHVVDRSMEAELLTLFMESALIAVDNRLLVVHDTYYAALPSPPRYMFLNYHAQFSVPTARTITGHLLERLMEHKVVFVNPSNNHFSPWMIPIEQEKIANCDPDTLFIATEDSQPLTSPMNEGPLARLKARVHYLDDDIQQSNTQYIVLAYFDLADAILSPFGGL